ncbi:MULTISPECIES: adenylate/guanylate cyclase domain-containing protein [unclassified Sphingomonas]|uniref:adenylate/guanylate cyclase domain-containing protein n=1 Tax=unclassified Sphingomonas TaxID=196159 RepID=UPI0006F4614D|nr:MULTISPECIES: adenylate/guanylate cyclase domain-containing protein [unclassified Sphingomonas]KQX20098.1 guanylate cyclase [Sphingomonas sp. Root1294]KQY67349.1 guanylate cyclase [Sphingomonas sp. Root50]KRB90726.1 guanylate cyclase [Sphingomonas sp. Root720]
MAGSGEGASLATRIRTFGPVLRKTLRQIGTTRLIVTAIFLILGLAFARYSWNVMLAKDAERALFDVRLLLASPRVETDPRIAMVTFTEDTLRLTGRRSPLDRAMLAKGLLALDKMKPKAIGIDILVDQPTPEDQILIDAFRTMKTPTYLGFASNATNKTFMTLDQETFLRDFLKQTRPGNVHATSIRLLADDDGVMRSWPNQPKELPPLMANSLTGGFDQFRTYQGSIRYRLPAFADRPVFDKFPIEIIANPDLIEAFRPQIEGRYILIGGDIPDIDQFITPSSRIEKGETTIGLEIHATLLAQMLDNVMPKKIPGWGLWLIALGVIGLGALTAVSSMRIWKLGLLLIVQAGAIVAVPFIWQFHGIDTQGLPVFGWLIGWVFAYSAVGTAARGIGSEQRNFAASALGKYLPGDIAKDIMKNPERLQLHGEKREIYALFSDLEGFTKLSHQIEPEMVAFLLNKYLDVLSETVLEHGGTIDKFVGDAIVAFWGAPISRPDDCERAVKCAVAMYEAGEQFRREAPEGVPPIGVTRVGVHFGEAIVGNFGGEGRIQYTALGDSMNTASRLEGANKYLKTKTLVSDTVIERSALTCFRPVGRIAVSGRSTPMEVFEPVLDFSETAVQQFTDIFRRYDAGDESALAEFEKMAVDNPDDKALANLIERLREVGPGGYSALDK